VNFTPRGEVRPWSKSLPLGAKWKMGLRCQFMFS
jgi:hypothetical protein